MLVDGSVDLGRATELIADAAPGDAIGQLRETPAELDATDVSVDWPFTIGGAGRDAVEDAG